jgi:CDP-diacylglycerol---glycerol-3-phosphate 3-phosphatidyltransferase
MENAKSGFRRSNFRRVQALTLARLPLAAVFAAVLLSFDKAMLFPRSPAVLIVCAVLLVLLELTDLFDGILARKTGSVTEWGAMLDPYADSIARITVYWALAYRGLAMALVPLVMACRDVTVAYCRILLMRSQKSVSARWSGKIKAQFQSVGSVLLLLGPLYWESTGKWTLYAISGVVAGVTAASIYEYAAAAISASKGMKEKEGHDSRAVSPSEKGGPPVATRD